MRVDGCDDVMIVCGYRRGSRLACCDWRPVVVCDRRSVEEGCLLFCYGATRLDDRDIVKGRYEWVWLLTLLVGAGTVVEVGLDGPGRLRHCGYLRRLLCVLLVLELSGVSRCP